MFCINQLLKWNTTSIHLYTLYCFKKKNRCSLVQLKKYIVMISTECQTFTIEKNWRSQNWLKCNSFEKQNGTRYIAGNVYFGIIIFSCLSSAKQSLRFLLICFVREIKGFYRSLLGNEVDFTDIMNIYLNVLAKKKFQKTETLTFRWKSKDYNNINVFLSLEIPCTFLLAKEKTWKTFLTLRVSHSKIVQKNKLCHAKQQ